MIKIHAKIITTETYAFNLNRFIYYSRSLMETLLSVSLPASGEWFIFFQQYKYINLAVHRKSIQSRVPTNKKKQTLSGYHYRLGLSSRILRYTNIIRATSFFHILQ